MVTKEEYKDTIMRMYDFCIASNHPVHIKEQFTQDLDFLAKLAEEHFEEKTETNYEHFEEKQETNYEHFEDEIIKNCVWSFALVDGKPNQCSGVICCNCGFSTGHGCREKIEEWLKSPYKKPTYKLSQFEFDLIQTYSYVHEGYTLSKFKRLIKLKDKGYFKCADYDTKIQDILENCEVSER